VKQKAIVYLKGLGFAYLATLVFAAFGWIHVGAEFEFSHLAVPLLTAIVVWTVLYLGGYFIGSILLLSASCIFSIGFLIGLVVIGYAGLKVAAFVTPVGWVSFTNDDLILFVICGAYALINLVVEPEKASIVAAAILNEDDDSTDDDD